MAKKRLVGIRPIQVSPFAGPEERVAALSDNWDEKARRMSALADRLGIPNDLGRWYTLSLRLAEQYVPELREIKQLGAPKKWGLMELGVLVVEIERLRFGDAGLTRIAEGRRPHAMMTIQAATNRLAAIGPWKSFLRARDGSTFGPDPPIALARQYARAKKDWPDWALLVRQAYLFHVLEGTVPEWDARVATIGRRKLTPHSERASAFPAP